MTLSLRKSVSLLWLTFACTQVIAQPHPSFPVELLKSLLPNGQAVDLSYFEQGLTVPPGVYPVDVYVNKRLHKRLTLEFKVNQSSLSPVLTKSLLEDFGVNVDDIDSLKNLSSEENLFPITTFIPNSTVNFDGHDLRLNLSFPQMFMKTVLSSSNDVVSPELWDNGISAGLFNYSLTASHYDNRNFSNSYNQNLNLLMNAQFNVGAWRLFSTGLFTHSKSKFFNSESSSQVWDYWNTYLQRDLPGWRSTIKAGDINTVSDVFDSFSMRGVSIGTNEQMLPYRDRSFMPTISGFANSYAQVFIKQNDRIVFQTNVSPGPWKLDQIPTLGNEGDLTVIVRESDGTERVEIVPYTSVPLMLREGQFRYDLNVGKYYRRDDNYDEIDPYFAQLTVLYGLPWNVTLLGGLLMSRDYQAYAVGSAFSLGRLGAISFDVIHSQVDGDSSMGRQSSSGAAYRVRYEKSLMSTGTSVNLATYRYTTKNYHSFADLQNGADDSIFDSNRMKHRWQLSVSQSLGDWGYISGSGNYVTYYDGKRTSKSWNVNYSKSFNGIHTRLSYDRGYEKNSGHWISNDRVMFNMTIPLGEFSNVSSRSLQAITTDYQVVSTKNNGGDRDYEHRVGLRYDDPSSDFNWGVSQVLGDRDARQTSLMMGYYGDRVDVSASYTRNSNQHSYMFAANGALLAHAGGITLSSRTFDSVALVEVPNVSGVKINQSANVRTDSFGYAVVTNLRNYAANELVIDPTTLPEGALLLEGTNQLVYPTAKSITRVVYPVRLGYQALIYLVQKNGQPLPFGVPVVLIEDKETQKEVMSFVGDQGRVYFAGLPLKGALKAKWIAQGQPVEATFVYELPDDASNTGNDFVNIPQLRLVQSE